MRHSYRILTLCFAIIIALLIYTLSETHNNSISSQTSWEKYDQSFTKLMHITVMLNQMQNLTRIYLATTNTDDYFELDELVVTASAVRSIYIKHYIELEELNLDDAEKLYLKQINLQAGKIRLEQMEYDKILIQNATQEKRLDLAIKNIITPQNETQVLMQNFLHYIRSNTMENSRLYHEHEDIGQAKTEKLQLFTIYLTFLIGVFAIIIIFKSQKTIQDKNNALSKAESFLHSTINSTPISLIILNKQGQIIMANNNAAKLFMYSQKELTTMNISNLIPEDIRHKHHHFVRMYSKKPSSREMNNGLNISALRKSGEIFPAEVGLSPVDGQDELYIACSIKDITQQKAMENAIIENKDKAERANQAKSEFLANVSHELRTPLHAILSFSRLGIKTIDKQSERPISSSKLENYFNKIFTSGNKLLNFINDLLDSAKFESGKMEFEFESNDIGSLVDSFITEQEARIDELALEITTSTGAYNHSAKFDKHYIGQAINNLISNAIKYSPHGGHIYISITPCIYQEKNAIQFSIEDEGAGIPEDQLDFIFEKFAQSSNKISGGTGLGLSLCKNIIQAHGGKIWAENKDKKTQEKAQFSFIIPVTQS
ncbi:MAG: ATP-binding protein [Gammaproteobacteria bacterium]|nr:ATP-binding protein [Gammaproteobacteria bacterium]